MLQGSYKYIDISVKGQATKPEPRSAYPPR